MAVESQMPGQGGPGSAGFVGTQPANVILRPVLSVDASEEFSGTPSQLSVGGSAGVSAADFSFVERRYAGRSAGVQEGFLPHDGLGAMRGLVLVLGLYLVMGVVGLGGLMLWHWLG